MTEIKKLLSNSLIVFAGTIIGSAFSYLFNMMMGRMLGPEHYGSMTALMSVITIVSVGGGAILTVVMKYSSDLYHEGYFDALKKLFSITTKYLLILSSVLFLILLILAKPITTFFAIDSTVPAIIAIFSVVFGYLIVINRGILQGLQKFMPLSITNALESLLKFIFGIALVKVGLSLNGALSAIVLATAIVYFVTYFLSRRELNVPSKDESARTFHFDKKEIFKYALPVFISTFFLVIAMNIDVIMVKHFFPAREAGLYSAVSTVGKIILFITAPIISVMFPMISERKIKGNKHFGVLFLSIVLTLLAGLAIVGIYVVMPSKVLSILYGSGFTDLYYLLPGVGFAFLCYSLVNLLSNYFLAIEDYVFLWIFGAVILLQLGVIWFWHPTIFATVMVVIVSFSLLFFLMMIYYLFTKKEQILSLLQGERLEP